MARAQIPSTWFTAALLTATSLLTPHPAQAAGGFFAYTDMLGYRGTVQNLSHPANTYQGAVGPWATHDPRLATLYVSVGSPNPDVNILASSYNEHSPSNQIDSFFALYDDVGAASVQSASGGWDSSHTVFTVDVTGTNSAFPNSRFWQPDAGVDYGVNIISYNYHVTATFGTPAAVDTNGLLDNVGDPTHIAGTFTGQFIPMFDATNNPLANGDLYSFAINLNSDWFTTNGGTDPTIIPYISMGGPQLVPEPATLGLAGLGLLGALFRRPRNNCRRREGGQR